MVGTGRGDQVFYAAKHDLQGALNWATKCDFIHGVFLEEKLIGVGFVENVLRFNTNQGQISRGEVGFGFLPSCSIFQALDGGRKMLDTFFNKLDIDHLFGTTPEPNKAAIAYAKRLGFSIYGPVPDFCAYNGDYVGIYTSHLSRTEWTKKNSKNSISS